MIFSFSLQEFVACCTERRKLPIIFKIEYSEAVAAAAEAAHQPQLTGLLPANLPQNRNQEVVPYDANRVKLREGESGSDYINASFCSGLVPGTSYIVTQGSKNIFFK
jgi:protein tyrosine phosphatase